jgi:hypothetical protein
MTLHSTYPVACCLLEFGAAINSTVSVTSLDPIGEHSTPRVFQESMPKKRVVTCERAHLRFSLDRMIGLTDVPFPGAVLLRGGDRAASTNLRRRSRKILGGETLPVGRSQRRFS